MGFDPDAVLSGTVLSAAAEVSGVVEVSVGTVGTVAATSLIGLGARGGVSFSEDGLVFLVVGASDVVSESGETIGVTDSAEADSRSGAGTVG